jgi:MerR family transcriptional regulator, light-induced transcriptional regulator
MEPVALSVALQRAYTDALCSADEQTARQVIEKAQQSGLDTQAIYLKIITPSMVTIGELWERSELSIAQEHLATAITERVISALGQPTRPDHAEHGTMIVGCVEDERHALGARIFADLACQHGWQVLYLGADVPIREWIALVKRMNADAVAISVNLDWHIAKAKQLTVALREAYPNTIIMVGGAAFHGTTNDDIANTSTAHQMADVYHADPVSALQIAANLAAQRKSGK